MTLYIKIFIIEASKWSEMLEKLPLKSTKYNLDFSNFWEFENESLEWEWEFSQKNWELRLRMRWEFSLRVSISRSRWVSQKSDVQGGNTFFVQFLTSSNSFANREQMGYKWAGSNLNSRGLLLPPKCTRNFLLTSILPKFPPGWAPDLLQRMPNSSLLQWDAIIFRAHP